MSIRTYFYDIFFNFFYGVKEIDVLTDSFHLGGDQNGTKIGRVVRILASGTNEGNDVHFTRLIKK